MSNLELIRSIERKDNKSETEYELLRYYYAMSIISEILVGVSKWHLSREEAIQKIRECLNENL